MEWLIVGAIFGFIAGHMLGKKEASLFIEVARLEGRLEVVKEYQVRLNELETINSEMDTILQRLKDAE